LNKVLNKETATVLSFRNPQGGTGEGGRGFQIEQINRDQESRGEMRVTPPKPRALACLVSRDSELASL